MSAFIPKIFRLLAIVVAALLGLGMAVIFICSSVIAITVLLITGKIAVRPSAIKEYFMRAQAARKPAYGAGSFQARPARPVADIIDVEAKEVK